MLFSLQPTRPSVHLLAAVVFLAGCGGERLDLVPVSGQITFDGKPLKTGAVSFHPVETTGHVPTGIINSDGRYTLSTSYQPGAPPGRYKVVVHATEPVEVNPGKASPGLPKSIIPTRYNDASTTPLDREVAAGNATDVYDLRLEK
ncbi:MAG TPA: hypothetical protein VFV87_01975 [Pirellulaceae bacterium]|nr:hypothetical protein [Pirellulaceae bacterium]